MPSKIENLPEDLIDVYAAIGSIASGWSHVELAVNSTLWRIAHVDHHQGACLTAQIPSMRNRLQALVSLLKLNSYSKSIVNEVNKFSDKADKVARKRNRVIHDPISSSDDSIEAVTITSDRELVYGFSGDVFDRYRVVDQEIGVLHRLYQKIDLEIQEDASERARKAHALLKP